MSIVERDEPNPVGEGERRRDKKLSQIRYELGWGSHHLEGKHFKMGEAAFLDLSQRKEKGGDLKRGHIP